MINSRLRLRKNISFFFLQKLGFSLPLNCVIPTFHPYLNSLNQLLLNYYQDKVFQLDL